MDPDYTIFLHWETHHVITQKVEYTLTPSYGEIVKIDNTLYQVVQCMTDLDNDNEFIFIKEV